MRYAVLIHKDSASVYGVTVPDIPGCFSAGETIEEALDNAREAIYAHLELLAEDGQPIPDDVKINIDELAKDEGSAGAIFAMVEVDIEDIKGPAERINLTVPRRALSKIDLAADSLHYSRSALMTKAALQFIASQLPATKQRGGTFSKPIAATSKRKVTRKSGRTRAA